MIGKTDKLLQSIERNGANYDSKCQKENRKLLGFFIHYQKDCNYSRNKNKNRSKDIEVPKS